MKGQRVRIACRIIWAPALSAMSAVVRLTISSRPSVIDGDMTLAPNNLLGRVVAALSGRRRLHGLAVDHARGRACRSARALAVDHQRHVMDGAEQKHSNEAPKP